MARMINIVGAGLAGSIVARVLREEGHTVRVYDDFDPFSASRASSNLYCAGWLKKWAGDETARGIEVLDRLFADSVQLPFGGSALNVKLVQTQHVLLQPDVNMRVERLEDLPRDADTTVVCTGHRARDLLPEMPEVWSKVGHCLLFKGQWDGPAHLSFVSPFTHQKVFQYDAEHIYYADSVAVLRDKYFQRQGELLRRTKVRASKFGLRNETEYRVGFRPFIDGYPHGYVAHVRPSVYAVNSGGKNGMVAYAWAAVRLAETLR